MNTTLSNLNELIINGSIPLDVTVSSSTNWLQFFTTILVTIIASFGIWFILYFPMVISTLKGGGGLRKLSKLSKRNVVLIKHTKSDLFSGSMIDQDTLRQLSEVMNKMQGKPFDLILHTPGGDIFSSLAISRLIKQYPKPIRSVIPLYSMSGGSLLALSTSELLMTPNASLGPIDPQLGNLFKYGSARTWDEIVRMKGKKAEDQSISFAMMGRQYTKSIQNHLRKTIDFSLNRTQKERLIKFLTDGKIEHAYPLTTMDLKSFGIDSKQIVNKEYLKVLFKLISSKGKEGVHYHIYKQRRWA